MHNSGRYIGPTTKFRRRADRRVDQRLSAGLRVVDRLAAPRYGPTRQPPGPYIYTSTLRGEVVRIWRDRLGILLVLGAAATSGRDRKVAYVANFVSGVTIDCVDPQRVARFWSALLGREPGPSQAGWVYLGHRGDPQPRLVFQPVPEPKAGKVRIHLDVTVDDVDEAIELVTSLGGRTTDERHDYDEGVVVVMADPEGHEFCLVQYY